ncbi:hypothetical protein RND71_022775 [Anisodus tanguticus]|uniref:Uncharacterized protein n=1 Tax=Anisodus tanguticus TaxID=243964 RepID=A0AAE1RT64_9SOLA|nr:hypothetical protein RND71_022775 [Anisodus tanguticus]
MKPPEICKMVGRPKVKRGRVRNENLKRQGEWSSSRKGKPMTCSTCHQSGHNARGCAKRFNGSSNTTTMLESEDNFPSSSSTTTVLKPDPSLRTRSFSEVNIMILKRMEQPLATPTRRISFIGDSTGMNHPTNMPYQPPNKAVITGNKLEGDKREDEDKEGE